MSALTFNFLDEDLTLLPEKAIYWSSKKILLIADVHLGKSSHFRKNGIAIPAASAKTDLDRLSILFQKVNPKKVIFLGDLFHSTHNQEWNSFENLLEQFLEIDFTLILGNHDILEERHYKESRLNVSNKLNITPFSLTHEPSEKKEKQYNLAGHIHPGVKLKGKGKLGIQIPCFYFGKHGGILPAFGNLTGLYSLKPKKTDFFFGIVGDLVVKL